MTEQQLIAELKAALADAKEGERVVSIHLFGIRFARELSGHNKERIAVAAGLGPSLKTEISKGAKLAPYVTIKS